VAVYPLVAWLVGAGAFLFWSATSADRQRALA